MQRTETCMVIADPILLLAAAAAAVDSKHQEEAHERHRASGSSLASYERPHSAETKPNVDLLGNYIFSFFEIC